MYVVWVSSPSPKNPGFLIPVRVPEEMCLRTITNLYLFCMCKYASI